MSRGGGTADTMDSKSIERNLVRVQISPAAQIIDMPILIKSYFGTDEAKIRAKQHNIIIGISLGNKYFSDTNIAMYLRWALDNTKEDVLVFTTDKIQAVNFEVLNEYSPARSMSVSLRKGNEVAKRVKAIVGNLPIAEQKKVHIITWEKVEQSAGYQSNLRAIWEEFGKNDQFRESVLRVVKEKWGDRAQPLTEEQYEKLAAYVLNELPMLVAGIELEDKIYDLLPYPGLGLVDELAAELQKGKLFTELSQKLIIKKPKATLDAYVQ